MRISCMKTFLRMMSICLLTAGLGACGEQNTPISGTAPVPLIHSTSFFEDTDLTRALPEEPQIVRSRFVKINLDQVLDESGRPRDVKEITLNLFSDVVYNGVIEQTETSGDSISWTGVLRDVENSYFTMVYTSGVFMGHFASPEGIYEAVIVEDDLYRVIMIDQTKFPGGEG